nr:aminopeptidase P family protein [Saprospiraceae bacterium]
MSVSKRIDNLRLKMNSKNAQAVIVHGADPHQSEYLPNHWKAREWISGFTGSFGIVVIGMESAGLWTDSRYFIQAEEELEGSGIDLFKWGVKGEPSVTEWLIENLDTGSTVYTAADAITPKQKKSYLEKLKKSNINLQIGEDLVGDTWSDRPEVPANSIYLFDGKFAQQSRGEKLTEMRKIMREKEADYVLVVALDEVAYLLNLRGSDVDCNPVFLSYLLVGHTGATLFINQNKVGPDIESDLRKSEVEIKPYDSIHLQLERLPAEQSILVDPSVINCGIYDKIKANRIEERSPVVHMKAIKHSSVHGHIRQAMARDGVALFRAFNWLKSTIPKRPVKESELADKIAECRAAHPHYKGESFPAIVGYKGNGAIVHYKPTVENSSSITPDGMLLIDSGGQYLDGTTDTTRTLHLSTPTPDQKRNFTLVLKGMIALSTAVFPEGTTGVQLDILARNPLWQEGLNFGHGTGHGVGYFLNVHEPPQGFVPNLSERGTTPIEEGMITSNEPGYYRQGEYGIRCENLVLCQKSIHDGFYCFETLTLYPFDKKLIEVDLLSPDELFWLNKYHQQVFNQLSPLLEEDEIKQLARECELI